MAEPSAGYSGTPQLRKLGISAGSRLAVVGRPRGWDFAEPPVGVIAVRGTVSPVDVLVVFARTPAELDGMAGWGERVFPAGSIWVAWPRKASGHVSEVDENLIRTRALDLGLVDVKVAAIDVDWSGLKLVWRKELRGAR